MHSALALQSALTNAGSGFCNTATLWGGCHYLIDTNNEIPGSQD